MINFNKNLRDKTDSSELHHWTYSLKVDIGHIFIAKNFLSLKKFILYQGFKSSPIAVLPIMNSNSDEDDVQERNFRRNLSVLIN